VPVSGRKLKESCVNCFDDEDWGHRPGLPGLANERKEQVLVRAAVPRTGVVQLASHVPACVEQRK
jgi:hypothetical protein